MFSLPYASGQDLEVGSYKKDCDHVRLPLRESLRESPTGSSGPRVQKTVSKQSRNSLEAVSGVFQQSLLIEERKKPLNKNIWRVFSGTRWGSLAQELVRNVVGT